MRSMFRRYAEAMSCLIFIATGLTAFSAVGRDRPGTPNNDNFYKCDQDYGSKPSLCFSFTLTNDEPSRIELDVVREGAGYSPRLLCTARAAGYCLNTSVSNWRKSPNGQPNIPVVTRLADLDFATTYCIKVRVRRSSDQVVSERWSNAHCLRTDAPYPPPAAPAFTTRFLGTQWLDNPRRQIPEKLSISYSTPQFAGGVDVSVSDVNGASLMQGQPFPASSSRPVEISIPPSSHALRVQLCARNFTGRTCATQVANVDNQGLGPVNAPSAGPAFTSRYAEGMNLPGRDFRSVALDANTSPRTCQDMCGVDGLCRAWTWVRPGIQGPKAMCWLKGSVPPAVRDGGTVSGVR